MGRKGRDFFRRRYPVANAEPRPRKAPVQITGEHIGMLNQLNFDDVQKIAENVIDRYTREEIDAVYVVFNEFKSVIAQRLVVDEVLPVEEIGERVIRDATEAHRGRAGASRRGRHRRRRKPAGHDTSEVDRRAAQFATAEVDYIYEQPPGRAIPRSAAEVRGGADLSRHDGVGGGRTCGAHDGHGFGKQQCRPT